MDEWNITSLPRSIVPHLKPRNGTHQLPMVRPDGQDGQDGSDGIDEEAVLERLKELKVIFFLDCVCERVIINFFSSFIKGK